MKFLYMDIKINPNCFFIFDLDDTLFQEIDYLKSAFLNISSKLSETSQYDIYEEMLSRYKKKQNVFAWVLSQYRQSSPHLNLEWLLKEYREHRPTIQLSESTDNFLKRVKHLKISSGLITDGRSITQRNKLKALGIDNYFKDIIISEEFGTEKPDEKNFLFRKKYPEGDFYFFGDNTFKDFIVPKKLGWQTICLKNMGNHIHDQVWPCDPAPDHLISSFQEIRLVEAS